MLRTDALFSILLAGLAVLAPARAYRVPIRDTDDLREVCSGMWGGKEAFIEVDFDPTSSGQVALVIYEWGDVPYLGVETPDNSKTYICTTSAVRSNLCTTSQLGEFITSPPAGKSILDTSIFTTALKFSDTLTPSPTTPTDTDEEGIVVPPEYSDDDGSEEEIPDTPEYEETEGESEEGVSSAIADAWDAKEAVGADSGWARRARRRVRTGERQVDDEGDYEGGLEEGEGDGDMGGGYEEPEVDGSVGGVTTYSAPITYAVAKTGYYCVGIVPVTLVNSAAVRSVTPRQAQHAEYSGVVLFRNTFDGELPAVEYPKINFYLFLSVVYFALGCGWAFLCFKYREELLPMQYYISGTIIFLIIEMMAQFAYYRYINKHGGGAASLAFLFVIAILNAARNSLSFFLLLIVSMGLSVVTQSLGSVMNKVRALTAFHFVFGVLYAVGTVEVELDSASLIMVLVMIFPLALTLTAFLMWIIVSLNGTILHLQARKQRYKLQKFQRLWRILVIAVIAVAAFFVVSSMSLSNRLDEDYAPRNWKYRWILLDGSLATIYLVVFSAVAWLWRPTRDNIRFSMSTELAQDEADADAEDYEIGALENGTRDGHRPLAQRDSEDDDDEQGGRKKVGEENVVFQMGEDSDEEGDHEGRRTERAEYRDMGGDGSGSEGESDSDSGGEAKALKNRGKDD